MSGEIENPMLFDSSREINETTEVKAVGRCEQCKSFLYSDDTYLKTEIEDLLCSANCLVDYLIADKYIEKIGD